MSNEKRTKALAAVRKVVDAHKAQIKWLEDEGRITRGSITWQEAIAMDVPIDPEVLTDNLSALSDSQLDMIAAAY